jgi:hypothetical protein
MKYVKWLVFGISSLGTLYFLFLVFLSMDSCYSDQICRVYRDKFLHGTSNLVFLFPLVFFFSIITLRMKIEVFSKWFNFAVWYVPILALTMIYFPLSVRGGLGAGSGITEGFNALVQILIFSIFVIISFVKIVRAYNKNK